MNNAYPPLNSSRLRLKALWGYYFPIVKWQLIIYAAVAVFCALMELLPVGMFLQFSLFTVVWTILPFMFMLSPLVFARNGDSRMVECQLPASASEKLTFYALYLLLAIPLIVFVLPEAALWLSTKIPALQNDLMTTLLSIRWKLSAGLTATNLLTATCGVMTCLCVVLKAKSNRILKAVASVIAVEFTVGIMGGIYGIISALQDNFTDLKPETPNDFQSAITHRMQETVADVGHAWAFQLVVGIIMAVYLIYIVRTIYKTLQRGGCCL